MPSDNSTFEQAVEALYHLNVGTIGKGAERHERPHKPLLLLAVLDLISSALQTFGTARVQDGARVRDLGSGPPLAPF